MRLFIALLTLLVLTAAPSSARTPADCLHSVTGFEERSRVPYATVELEYVASNRLQGSCVREIVANRGGNYVSQDGGVFVPTRKAGFMLSAKRVAPPSMQTVPRPSVGSLRFVGAAQVGFVRSEGNTSLIYLGLWQDARGAMLYRYRIARGGGVEKVEPIVLMQRDAYAFSFFPNADSAGGSLSIFFAGKNPQTVIERRYNYLPRSQATGMAAAHN